MNIEIDSAPFTDNFIHLFFQIQLLETKEDAKFDPRKYKNVLAEFEHLLSAEDYNKIVKEFKRNVRLLLREVLNC